MSEQPVEFEYSIIFRMVLSVSPKARSVGSPWKVAIGIIECSWSTNDGVSSTIRAFSILVVIFLRS